MMHNKSNKWILLLLSIFLLSTSIIEAQSNFRIPYQAVARDAQGQILANQTIEVLISLEPFLTTTKPLYQEIHYLKTDEEGYFNLAVGDGQTQNEDYQSIDFSKQMLSLAVEIRGTGQKRFYLMSRQELQSVPYAFHARTAAETLPEADLRSQSIYWTTSGNNKTRPPIHFIGTRDEQDLVMRTNNEIREIVTKDGQVQIYSGVSGDDGDKASYPLTIEGSDQGIFIQVEKGTPDNDNNFMTFANENGETVGRIEGQTTEELLESAEYINEIFQFSLEVIALGADAIGVGIETGGFLAAAASAISSLVLAWQAPGWTVAAGGAGAQLVGIGVNIGALEEAWSEFERLKQENVGVVYMSGSGDYAEWIPKKYKDDNLMAGEIIGVKAGQLSRKTFNADHVMVVSTSPIILGNAPQIEDKKDFEKVAFLGQVPVKVRGPVAIGDYILPSGKGDGFGVAVNPNQLPARRHKEIVGIAWTSAEDAPVNYVKVGVGLQHNDLADEVEALSERVDALIERVGLTDHPLLQKKEEKITENQLPQDWSKTFLAEQYLKIIKSKLLPAWQKPYSVHTNLGL
ncbi:MAG: hypothetical protein AAF705_05685 [Bacteroidota bacterium]